MENKLKGKKKEVKLKLKAPILIAPVKIKKAKKKPY